MGITYVNGFSDQFKKPSQLDKLQDLVIKNVEDLSDNVILEYQNLLKNSRWVDLGSIVE